MNIKDAERLSGVSVRNIRFYEQKGLLKPARNAENDYREYCEEDIRRLQLIRALRMVDMPLEQIREVVDGKMELRQAALLQKEKLEEQIKKIKTVMKFCEELSQTDPDQVSEVLMRMDKPENKRIFSKAWRTDYAEKLKALWSALEPVAYFSVIVLIVIIMTIFRFCAIAVPTWIHYDWYYVPMVTHFICGTTIFTILVLAICAGAVMLVPYHGYEYRKHRYVIRPILAALAVFVISSIGIAGNEYVEDAIWDRHVTAKHDEVREFIQIADVAFAYSTTEYQGHYVEEFPELVMDGRYVTDTMMIDYDTMTVGFCFHYIGNFELVTFPLTENGPLPNYPGVPYKLNLPGSGGMMTMYFNDPYDHGSLNCMKLTTPDGSVYTARGLIDPNNLESHFRGTHVPDDYYKWIEGFPKQK